MKAFVKIVERSMTRRSNPYESMEDFFSKVEEDLNYSAPYETWQSEFGYIDDLGEAAFRYCGCLKPEIVNISLFREILICKRCGRDIRKE